MYESLKDPKEVRCRKRHACEWCGETIEVFSKCIYRVYKWDGELINSHTHNECFAAMKESSLDDGFETFAQKRGKTYEESHG